MNTLVQSSVFSAWLQALADDAGKAAILRRLNSAIHENFGDCEPVGEGISEMRIHSGPGYRVYFTRSGSTIYLLLCAGTKKTQRRDIRNAKAMMKELRKP